MITQDTETSQETAQLDLHLRVGCEIVYDVPQPTPLVIVVQAQERPGQQRIIDELQLVEPPVPVERVIDAYGSAVWKLLAPAGRLRIRYDAHVAVASTADPVLTNLPRTPVEALPGDVLSCLWPTRYCPSDLLIDEAWRLFGDAQGGWAQVQAVCDWLHENIVYGTGSVSTTDSRQAYEARRGVCRDFAHLGVTFCRALNIPARYVCGYLPDIAVEPPPTPMDFHAWFEAYLDGAWRTFDARHNEPRIGRTIIVTGRDAVDGAWATVFGNARLVSLDVWADEASPELVLERPAG